MNIKEMSMDELEAIRKKVEKEIDFRNRKQKEAAWQKVREAIAEYLILYEEIRVETYDNTYYLNQSVMMEEFGVFNMEGE